MRDFPCRSTRYIVPILADWNGNENSPAWQSVVAGISALAGADSNVTADLRCGRRPDSPSHYPAGT